MCCEPFEDSLNSLAISSINSISILFLFYLNFMFCCVCVRESNFFFFFSVRFGLDLGSDGSQRREE